MHPELCAATRHIFKRAARPCLPGLSYLCWAFICAFNATAGLPADATVTLIRHGKAASKCLTAAWLVQVIDNAREVWDKDESKTALRKRVSFVGGDFFKKGAPCQSTRVLLRQSIPASRPDVQQHMAPISS